MLFGEQEFEQGLVLETAGLGDTEQEKQVVRHPCEEGFGYFPLAGHVT